MPPSPPAKPAPRLCCGFAARWAPLTAGTAAELRTLTEKRKALVAKQELSQVCCTAVAACTAPGRLLSSAAQGVAQRVCMTAWRPPLL